MTCRSKFRLHVQPSIVCFDPAWALCLSYLCCGMCGSQMETAGKSNVADCRFDATLCASLQLGCSFIPWRNSRRGQRLSHYRGFTITLRHTTLGRTPLGELSARHRDLYLTTYNTHNRQIFMPPAGFELTIPASERPQIYGLDRAATGIGIYDAYTHNYRGCNYVFIMLQY